MKNQTKEEFQAELEFLSEKIGREELLVLAQLKGFTKNDLKNMPELTVYF